MGLNIGVWQWSIVQEGLPSITLGVVLIGICGMLGFNALRGGG